MVFRHSANDFLLTAAEPNLSFLQNQIGSLEVSIEDVSDQYAMLAVQGPRSRAVIGDLAPEVHELGYFGHTQTKVAGSEVTVSRTGFTGDLGFELRIPADNALPVLDAVMRGRRAAPHASRSATTRSTSCASRPGCRSSASSSRPAATPSTTTIGSPPMSSGSAGCSRASRTTPDPSSDGERSSASAPPARHAGRPSASPSTGRLRRALLRRRAGPAERRTPGVLGDDALRRRR